MWKQSSFVYVFAQQTKFPMCLTRVWSTPRVDSLPHLPLDCKQGPLLHKDPDEWGRPALRAALAFEQGLIQNDWTGEEVEGGCSFNVQTLFYNVHRLSSHSVLWRILWATNIKKKRSLEKEEGERVSKWRISLHFWAHAWSAFLAIFPQVIHSPCLHYGSAMHFTKKKKKPFNCEEVLEPALSWHVWCLFSRIKAAPKAQSRY